MKPHEALDRLIAEQSSQWIETLEHGGAEEQRAFSAWLKDSSRHVKGFLLMTALDEEIKHLDADKRYPIRPLEERRVAALVSAPHSSPQALKGRGKTSRWRWVAAAGIAASIIAWYSPDKGPSQHIDCKTILGEQRVFELADGSILHLNTQSHVKVAFSAAARDIRLVSGEALFKVAQDPVRPFRVRTAEGTIQAIGTQFNVYQRGEATLVSVIEGRVSVVAERSRRAASTRASTALAAGEEAQLLRNGVIERRRSSEKTQIAAWRHRQLIFKQSPLAEVVAEFNRYNRNWQFRVEGDLAARRLYSGVFDADDPQSLLQLLEREGDIALAKNDREIIISGR